MKTYQFQHSHQQSQSGFTLIELLVTVTLAAVVLAIGIPNLREFVVRNQMASAANEFSGNLNHARSEAVSRNTCVTMCQSADTAGAIAGAAVTCASADFDWLRGWIIFENTSCNNAFNAPAGTDRVLRVVQPPTTSYQIVAAGGTPSRKLMFDGRGLLGGAAANLTLEPVDSGDSIAMNNRRQICIAATGRVTIRKYTGAAC